LLLSLCAEFDEVAGYDAVGHAPAAGGGTDPAAGDLLRTDHLEPEVRDPAPAELLGDGHADDSRLCSAAPHLPVDEVVRLPLLEVRHDLSVEEGCDRASESLVVVVVQVPL